MKRLLLILFLLPATLNASELLAKIEKVSAVKSSCTVENPCEITIEGSGKFYKFYIARVKRSVKITEYGVLKYTTGSVSYHTFDANGAYIGTRHSP